MYVAAQDRLVTIEEVSDVYGISRNHLMKIANVLARANLLAAVRGRSGGLSLPRAAETIRLGEIVRATETDFDLVECFSAENQCIITRRCRLKGILHEAADSFLASLDRYTLADLALRPRDFGIPPLR